MCEIGICHTLIGVGVVMAPLPDDVVVAGVVVVVVAGDEVDVLFDVELVVLVPAVVELAVLVAAAVELAAVVLEPEAVAPVVIGTAGPVVETQT
jgi:hypothetical protein